MFHQRKDSTALLFTLEKIERHFPSASLIPIYIDEGVKGYNEHSRAIVEQHVKRLGLPLSIFTFSKLYGATLDEVIQEASKKSKRLPACSYCGILRRTALNEAAKSVHATKIATGHNLDDAAQTILMNVLRGDIHRIAKKNNLENGVPRRIKPLLLTPEKEVVLYNFYKGLTYQLTECPYRGDAFRNDIRGFLNRLETKNPNIKQTLVQLSNKLGRLVSQPYVDGYKQTCQKCGQPSRRKTCKTCEVLNQLPIHYPPYKNDGDT